MSATAAPGPGKTIVATDAGIVGDGSTLNSAAIQKTIDDCSAAGGGTIEFPAGRYVTGTIQLKDSVVLRAENDAVLLGSTNPADYRNLDPFTAGDGVPLGYALYSVDGANLQNVAISNVTMSGVAVPVSVRLGARLKTFRAGQTAKPPGRLHGITIQNVRATGAGMIGLLVNGVPNHPVEDITLSNLQIELPGRGTAEDAKRELPGREAACPEFSMFGRTLPASGIYQRHVRGVRFQDVRMTLAKPDARPAAIFIDVQGVTPSNFLDDFRAELKP